MSTRHVSREDVALRLHRERAVAILRLADAERMHDVVEVLVAAGIRAIEITMTMPGAVPAIAHIAASHDGVLVGAGTVMDAAAAASVMDAGAQFVVSPVLIPDVLAACHERGVAAIPGAFTPTELHAAASAGADVVKLFPASMLAPRYLRDVLGPMPGLRLMPTGGVTFGNAPLWLDAGAWAVGLGADLIDPSIVARRAWDELRQRAALLRAILNPAVRVAPPA